MIAATLRPMAAAQASVKSEIHIQSARLLSFRGTGPRAGAHVLVKTTFRCRVVFQIAGIFAVVEEKAPFSMATLS